MVAQTANNDKFEQQTSTAPSGIAAKGKFPMILEQEVDAYNKRKLAERKTLFEQNSQIVMVEEEEAQKKSAQDAQDLFSNKRSFAQRFTFAKITEENDMDDEAED